MADEGDNILNSFGLREDKENYDTVKENIPDTLIKKHNVLFQRGKV